MKNKAIIVSVFIILLLNLIYQPHIKADDIYDEVIVKIKNGFDINSIILNNLPVKNHFKVVEHVNSYGKKYGLDRAYVLKIERANYNGVLNWLENNPHIEFVEPNYMLNINMIPDDPYLSNLWGLDNTGQSGGTADADIDSPEAWAVETGSQDVVVAVIDTGVDYNHEDLDQNMWLNSGELPGNDIDDDGNGLIDDVYGWDFYNNNNDPFDDHGHGTHCAGTIGAIGNNGIGVTGVNWNVKIMSLKFLGASGSGSTYGAVNAINYGILMGADIMSNSWGGGGFSQLLKDAIMAANDAGILFVAAAGNANSNNDIIPHYPSNYDVPNMIAVAATDHKDIKAGFSNYGAESVDLGAPGVSIYSTVPTGSCYLCQPSGYSYLSGTSMATPHVAGVAALLKCHYPSISVEQIKNRIFLGVDPIPSLAGITVTGGRLNAFNSLEDDNTSPALITDLATSNPGLYSINLTWTSTGDDGMVGNAHSYDIRYSTMQIYDLNWDSAIQIIGEPLPLPPGSVETFTVDGLDHSSNYYFGIKVIDNVGNPSDLSNVAMASTLSLYNVFQDDMESGVNGWSGDGLWHLETIRSKSIGTSWAYNTGSTDYNYDVGHTFGSLTSENINLTDYNYVLLEYSYLYETELGEDGFGIKSHGSNWAQGITFDNRDSTLWIVDSEDSYLYHFNKFGNKLTDGFSISESPSPIGVTIDKRDYSFWVADTSTDYVYHFDDSGVLLGGFNVLDYGVDEPRGIAFDDYDNSFWIADLIDDYVYHFDSDGDLLGDGFDVSSIGCDTPTDIAFDVRDNSFWIPDYNDKFAYHVDNFGSNLGNGIDLGSYGSSWPLGFTIGINDNSYWVCDPIADYVFHIRNADLKKVEIGINGAFTILDEISGYPMLEWIDRSIDISQYAGNIVQLRFSFDSLDENYNDYEGWYIDDIIVFAMSENENSSYSPVSDAGPDQIISNSDGTGNEAIFLDGSGSYDSDGYIVSYEWKEGETIISSDISFTQNFEVGDHILSLTVTDNDSLTDTDYVIISVDPNQLPVAQAGSDQIITVGDSVFFDGSSSYDTDGFIVSYIWDFGNGNTGAGEIVNHIYEESGSYQVLLTVTDNGGEVDTDFLIVDVELPVSFDASINSHTVNSRWDKKNNIGRVEVKLKLTIIAGCSDQLIFEELTDDTANWILKNNEVVVKVNRVRYVLEVTLNEFEDAVINLGSQGITLNAGDEVEISKLKLLYDSSGWHTLTAVLIDNSMEITSDTINFK